MKFVLFIISINIKKPIPVIIHISKCVLEFTSVDYKIANECDVSHHNSQKNKDEERQL